MPRFFTYYWKNDAWAHHQQAYVEGNLVKLAASNRFRQRGVSRGDHLYIVTVMNGRLYLMGKMEVAKVCDFEEAAAYLQLRSERTWVADDYAVALRATQEKFDIVLPLEIVRNLRFTSGGQESTLKFREEGVLDQQTLRGIRELTVESASALDLWLPEMQPVYPGQQGLQREAAPETRDEIVDQIYPEGAQRLVSTLRYDRNSQARRACLNYWGYSCVVCGFNFEEVYGHIGHEYIHVHHLRPLSEQSEQYDVNPITDLRPVCANCHSMMHRHSPICSIEELQAILRHRHFI